MFNFDAASRQSKQTMDGMLKSYSEVAKGFEAIATEAADYSKKSFMETAALMEALASSRSIEAAYELQTDYIKSAYEGFISQSTKMSDMYVDMARSAYKPYEATPVANPAAASAVKSEVVAAVAPAAKSTAVTEPDAS